MARTSLADNALFLSDAHNHQGCVEAAVVEAIRICRERGVRLTPQRRRVLQLVWGSHKPIGAYAILGKLRLEGISSAPPTVYRALEFLLDQGLIHRIESLNAYAGCIQPDVGHAGQFLVCSHCGSVGELRDERITRLVDESAARHGFRAEHQTIEVSGLCPCCREQKHGC